MQPNLGVKQRNNWDFTRLAFDSSVKGYKPVGDKMRKEVAIALDQIKPAPAGPAVAPEMKPPRFRVTSVKPSTLNFRDGPNGAKKGKLRENALVEKLSESDDWWLVRTKGGYVGWIYSSFLAPD